MSSKQGLRLTGKRATSNTVNCPNDYARIINDPQVTAA